MRIALVAHAGSPLTPATGQEPVSQAASVATHARGLAKLGHRVTVYARRDSRALPASAILAPRVTVEHVTAGPLAPLSGAELAACVAEFSDQLAQRWRRNPPDVVHAYFWTSGLAAVAAARDRDIPVVQTFGTLGVAERRDGSAVDGNDVRVRLEACLARSAHAVLAGTGAEAADLLSMGVPRAAVTVVPCGVDTAEFAPEGPAAKRGSRPRLLAVVPRLDGRQGLGTLLRMLARVPAAGACADAVLDGTTGVLIPLGRPELFARRVRDLLASPLRLEAFGIAAADRATARYSWDRISRETLAAYERCLRPAVASLAGAGSG